MGKVYSSILEKRTRNVAKQLLDENHCSFRPMHGCQGQIFCMRQLVEKFNKRSRDFYVCFVGLQKNSKTVFLDLSKQ